MTDDEFGVLLPQQTATRARTLADRIAVAIEAIERPGAQTLGVTVGVVSCPQHGTDVEKLLELADTAMYRAKAAGERIGEAVEQADPAG
jgi:diguanylate cyclase (GGDEF)-like protein